MILISRFALLLATSMCLLPFCITLALSAPSENKHNELSKLFSSKDLTGTIVISSLDGSTLYVHNKNRSKEKFSPASTFKILNTLIALEEKAITDENETIEWNGTQYTYPDWNHNHTLKTAFKVSCVWCYQELAQRVGIQKYYQYLGKTNYGNIQSQLSETAFWLDGSLTISALSQIDFLKSIYKKTLPFSPLYYETLKKIMIIEATSDYTLRAKTGWAQLTSPQTGWYIGYIETHKGTWFFAMNIEVKDKSDLHYRQLITREALKLVGIIE